MNPDRIIIGSSDDASTAILRAVYEGIQSTFLVTDTRTAELIKLVTNAFLAMKISFMNEISDVCADLGVDVADIASGLESDRRIGPGFLQAGLGFGGSCLPKDLRALIALAHGHQTKLRLLSAVSEINEDRPRAYARLLSSELNGLAGKRIALLGLSYKPQTSDARCSPAIELANELIRSNATVVAHNPVPLSDRGLARVKELNVRLVPCLQNALAGAHATVLATEWPEYVQLDFAEARRLMSGSLLVDARSVWNRNEAARAGLRLVGIGRGSEFSSDEKHVESAS